MFDLKLNKEGIYKLMFVSNGICVFWWDEEGKCKMWLGCGEEYKLEEFVIVVFKKVKDFCVM